MAEFENEVTDDVTDDVETSYEDDAQDTQEELEDITYEQAMEYKKRLAKAEKKLVELKRQNKSKPETKTEAITEQDIALREEVADFLLDNKDLKEYKSEILKYRKQGFTIKQAVALVENDDVTIENRRKTQSMNITSSEEPTSVRTITKEQLSNCTQEKFNEYIALRDSWKLKIV